MNPGHAPRESLGASVRTPPPGGHVGMATGCTGSFSLAADGAGFNASSSGVTGPSLDSGKGASDAVQGLRVEEEVPRIAIGARILRVDTTRGRPPRSLPPGRQLWFVSPSQPSGGGLAR